MKNSGEKKSGEDKRIEKRKVGKGREKVRNGKKSSHFHHIALLRILHRNRHFRRICRYASSSQLLSRM